MNKITLKDSLRVITIPYKGTKTVSVIFLVGVGSRFETKKITGLSHFLEHMVFKGTEKRSTFHDITSAIDKVGGIINAFTGKEYTGFWSKVSAEHFDTALDIVADVVQNPKLDPKEIEKERGVICEEINMYEDTPRENVGFVFEEVIFPGNPLGWKQAGTKEAIRSIARQDFEEYLNRFYGADNAVVVVAGNLDPDEAAKKVDTAFNLKIKKADKNYQKISSIQQNPQNKILIKPTEQAHFVLGLRGYGNDHPQKYPSKILGIILAGGMSSRLFDEIREKRGLAYYVKGFSHSYRDAGYFMVQAGVDNGKVEEAIKVILEEFEKMKKTGATEAELSKAKEIFKGHLLIGMEDSAELAEFYATKELMDDRIKTVDEVIAEVEKVSLSDIAQVAKDLFQNKNLNLAAIGNIKNQNKIINLLEV